MHDPTEALWLAIGIYCLSVLILTIEKTRVAQNVRKPFFRIPILMMILIAGTYNPLVFFPFVFVFVCFASLELYEVGPPEKE